MRIAAGLVLALAVAVVGYAFTTRGGSARPELTGVQIFDHCVAAEQRRIQRSLPRARARLLTAVRKSESTETPRIVRLRRRSVEYALRQMRDPGYAARAAAYGCSGPATVLGVRR